ncbi:MAG: WbqC family protein [Prevotella sp.]|jgi:hypothetical protein|nr:WbqC family protein [Prevotella sp.]
MLSYLSSAYLAPVQYYTKMLNGNGVFIEKYEHYVKQSYRNRCTILSANGPMTLSVPVEHTGAEKCLTKDVRMAEQGNWRHIHQQAIISAYNSSPFFEYYWDDFRPFYEKKYRFLFDFNEELRVLICELLGIDISRIRYTDAYRTELPPEIDDYRNTIHPKKHIADPCFVPRPYYQVFSEKFGFIANLSIIDLLFNMGNESLLVLKGSGKINFCCP